jgi:hypothetical protein
VTGFDDEARACRPKEYPSSQVGGSFGIEKALQMLVAGSRAGGK